MKHHLRYVVRVTSELADELEAKRAKDRVRIRKAVGLLVRQAEVETRHRKKLDLARLAKPLPFDHEPPVWQLSVGDWRVFYDVAGAQVIVRALRFKDPHRTTEEIL